MTTIERQDVKKPPYYIHREDFAFLSKKCEIIVVFLFDNRT